jgi:hypothetical protein
MHTLAEVLLGTKKLTLASTRGVRKDGCQSKRDADEKSPSLELKRASAAFPTTITTAATNQPVLIKCTQMH